MLIPISSRTVWEKQALLLLHIEEVKRKSIYTSWFSACLLFWKESETDMAQSENKALSSHGGYIKYCSTSNSWSSRLFFFFLWNLGQISQRVQNIADLLAGGSNHLGASPCVAVRSKKRGTRGYTLINSIRHVGWAFVLDLCSRGVFVVSVAQRRAMLRWRTRNFVHFWLMRPRFNSYVILNGKGWCTSYVSHVIKRVATEAAVKFQKESTN